MKTNKLIFLPLAVCTLSFNIGCNKTLSDSEMINVSCDAAIEKIDSFNATLSNVHEAERDSVTLSGVKNANANIYFYDGSKESYCESQVFGFYIYNDVHYILKNYYSNNKVKQGTPVTGKTRRIADKTMATLYELHNDPSKEDYIKDSTLSACCTVENKKGEYIVYFQADWDLRNDFFANNPYLKKYNSVIMTNGKIVYNGSAKKIKKINLNYYWINDHRSFASFDLDYTTNKFNYVDANAAEDVNTWDCQDDRNYKVYNSWNNGTFSKDEFKKLNYNWYSAYVGDITTDINALNLTGYHRSGAKNAKDDEIVEIGDKKDAFYNLYETVYQNNKEVGIRGDESLLSLDNAVNVNTDNCAKYGEAKTKLYWMYSCDKQKGFVYSKNCILPYIEQDNLKKYVDHLRKNPSGLNDNQKQLINKVYNYLDKLDSSEYFGEFATDDVIFKYYFKERGTTYRYNTYNAIYFSYQFIDAKNQSNVIEFIISENKISVGNHYGVIPQTRNITYNDEHMDCADGYLQDKTYVKTDVTFTTKPNKATDGEITWLTGELDDAMGFTHISLEYILNNQHCWITTDLYDTKKFSFPFVNSIFSNDSSSIEFHYLSLHNY